MNLPLPGLVALRPEQTAKAVEREPVKEARSDDRDFGSTFATTEKSPRKDTESNVALAKPADRNQSRDNTDQADASAKTEAVSDTDVNAPKDADTASDEPQPHTQVEGDLAAVEVTILPFAVPVEIFTLPETPSVSSVAVSSVTVMPAAKTTVEVGESDDARPAPQTNTPTSAVPVPQTPIVAAVLAVPVSAPSFPELLEQAPGSTIAGTDLDGHLMSTAQTLSQEGAGQNVFPKQNTTPETLRAALPVAGTVLPPEAQGSAEGDAPAPDAPKPAATPAPSAATSQQTSAQIGHAAESIQAANASDDMPLAPSKEVDAVARPAAPTPTEATNTPTTQPLAGTSEALPNTVETAQTNVVSFDPSAVDVPRPERGSALVPDAALLARPETARHVAAQIADVIRAGSDGALEITLRPEELGRLSLSFSRDGTAMQVTLTAERPETLDLVRRNIEVLEQDLKDLGYSSLAFSFGDRGNDQGQRDNGGGASPRAAQDPRTVTEAMITAQPTGRTASGGMDLRL